MKIPDTLKKISGRWYLLAAYLLVILYCILATGCRIGQKAVAAYKSGPDFPRDCANQFPPKVTPGKTDTVTIQGHTVDCDSVQAAYEAWWKQKQTPPATPQQPAVQVPPAAQKRIPCPPSRIIRKTDTIISTAELEACRRKADQQQTSFLQQSHDMQAQILELREQANTRTKQRNSLLIIIIAFVLGSYRKNITNFLTQWRR